MGFRGLEGSDFRVSGVWVFVLNFTWLRFWFGFRSRLDLRHSQKAVQVNNFRTRLQ